MLLRISPIVVMFVLGHASGSVASNSVASLGPDFRYRHELTKLNYEDLITLPSGARHMGKVLEWGDQILLFDASGRLTAWPGREVKTFETRRFSRHAQRGLGPDLTVAYVERLPRDTHWHQHVKLDEKGLPQLGIPATQARTVKPGANVTFKIHVLNSGSAPSQTVPCHISVDGQSLGRPLTIPPLDPGAEHVALVSWTWKADSQLLKIELDPEKRSPDTLRWNNVLTEPIAAQAVTVVVAKERYEAFRNAPNMVDSFCFEDYIQFHIQNLNAIFAASRYASTPQGVVERVRCDRIIVVDDPADPAARLSWLSKLHEGENAAGAAEYAALVEVGRVSNAIFPFDAIRIDWTLLQQIGRHLGLIDLKNTDTNVSQCYVRNRYERFAVLRHLSPDIDSLMYTPRGLTLTEPEANYLNAVVGRPRGFPGEYLYRLPDKITLEVTANNGSLLEGVEIDVFQLMGAGENAGRITGISGGHPIMVTTTDEKGRAELANLPIPPHKTANGIESRPSPFGRILSDGSNGLLLLRLRARDSEEFHFLPLSVCNKAFVQGATKEYVHPLATRFAVPGAQPSPLYAAARMADRSIDQPPLTIAWRMPEDFREWQKDIREFRVYKRTSFGGMETKPWILSAVRRYEADRASRESEETYWDEFTYDGPYSLDTHFAITTVTHGGVESNLSHSAFVAHGLDIVQFAIEGDAAYMSVQGDSDISMLYWDGISGTQPFSLKTDAYPGYAPGFSGIAAYNPGMGQNDQLIVADPDNHVLAFYDLKDHTLKRVLPERNTWPGVVGEKTGQFSTPMDVAVDGDGARFFVADAGNHRVQIVTADGKKSSILDPDFRFRAPYALGYANGHLCVTDSAGTRGRVYDVTQDPPAFVHELPPLANAGRGLVSKQGHIFITGSASETGTWGLLRFKPNDTGLTLVDVNTGTPQNMGKLFKPRGLYFYRIPNSRGFAYFCNTFPFDVRRVNIETSVRGSQN